MRILLVRCLSVAIGLLFFIGFLIPSAPQAQGAMAIFEGAADVGEPKHPGAIVYDAASRSFAVSGGGKNMWFAQDAFHFVWKKMSGDLSIAATIDFIGKGLDPHRKA